MGDVRNPKESQSAAFKEVHRIYRVVINMRDKMERKIVERDWSLA